MNGTQQPGEDTVTSKEEYRRRQDRFLQIMKKYNIDCVLLNQTQNIKYLSGADNVCSWIFIRQDGRQVALVLESDYEDYRQHSTVEDIRVFRAHDPLKHFRDLQTELRLKENSLAVEREHLKLFQFDMLEEFFGAKIHRSLSAQLVAMEARMIKTPEEIVCINEAAQLARQAMRLVRQHAQKGITEMNLACIVQEELRRQGSTGSAFLYIASDDRSSLAHTPPKSHELDRGPVTVDVHAEIGGYHADMARTILLDGGTPDQAEMYAYLREKVRATISSIKHGLNMLDLKRSFHKNLKLKEDWIVLTGPLLHGVGVVNSEAPWFEYPHQDAGYPGTLEENMVLASSNLGLSSKQGWGVRYEDTFLVTQDRPTILTEED
jgi:Xaa-Pro aminopeptidase